MKTFIGLYACLHDLYICIYVCIYIMMYNKPVFYNESFVCVIRSILFAALKYNLARNDIERQFINM